MAEKYTGKQAAQYIPGGAYGEGKETMALQTQPGVPMAAAEVPAAAMQNQGIPVGKPTIGFNSPMPSSNEITDTASFGPGRDASALPTPPQATDETAQLIMSLYTLYPDPDLARVAQRLKAEGRA